MNDRVTVVSWILTGSYCNGVHEGSDYPRIPIVLYYPTNGWMLRWAEVVVTRLDDVVPFLNVAWGIWITQADDVKGVQKLAPIGNVVTIERKDNPTLHVLAFGGMLTKIRVWHQDEDDQDDCISTTPLDFSVAIIDFDGRRYGGRETITHNGMVATTRFVRSYMGNHTTLLPKRRVKDTILTVYKDHCKHEEIDHKGVKDTDQIAYLRDAISWIMGDFLKDGETVVIVLGRSAY